MQWFLKNKRTFLEALKSVPGLSPLERVLLANREIAPEAVASFLNPSEEQLLDPFLFRDMEAACDLILTCMEDDVPIRIVGDYDQDGVAATTILVKGLRYFAAQLGVDPKRVISYAIPDRIEDGYGINRSIVDRAREDGIGLIITCDNGISAFDALDYAREAGIRVILTDHHQPVSEDGVEKYPAADCRLNPHCADEGYPFKDLCGAGVAYKLMEGLAEAVGRPRGSMSSLLQFACLGTICDVVPLIGENRIIAAEGLKRINETNNPGLRALLECNHWEKEITVYTVGFVIGPCVNASGRLFTARLGVELFLEKDPETVREYARSLYEFNEERKRMTTEGVEQGIAAVEGSRMNEKDLLMLYLPGVHESICGLVAGRIKEKYYLPTLVFTDAESVDGVEILKGSGRSIEAFNMYEGLSRFRDRMVAFGGHAMACGMSVRKDAFESLREDLQHDVVLTAEEKTPSIELDCQLPLERVDFGILEVIDRLGPYGAKNPSPVFGAKGVNVREMRLVGKNKNVLQMSLESAGRFFKAVMFQGDEKLREIATPETEGILRDMLRGLSRPLAIDICYRPEINEFRGNRTVQLMLRDLRISR